MQPLWPIEAGAYGDEAVPLLDEIRRQGMTGACSPYPALTKGAAVIVERRPLGPSDCAIGYGTYPFARRIQPHHPWVPDARCDPHNRDCATYYAHFDEFLLDRNFAIMPGVEVIRRPEWLSATLGVGGEVFARPTGCHELFVGRLIPSHSFANALAPTRYDPETSVMIATPRPIDRDSQGLGKHRFRRTNSEERIPYSVLRIPHSALRTSHPALRTPLSAPRTSHFALRISLSALRTSHFALRSPLSALRTHWALQG